MSLLLATVASLALIPAGTALAASEPGLGGRAALAQLNAQRAANGIPGDVSFDEAAAEGCRLHVAWMDRNGKLQHDEPVGSPGYTEAGDAAGNLSVLGGTWSEAGAGVWSSNPYENAPIHLMQLLSPDLGRTGIWGRCASTFPGYDRPQPAQPVLHTYPGDGSSGIYGAMVARESPFVPGDLVGLPEGTRTGPHIYVLGRGVGRGRLSEVTLSGPNGPVAVKTVDDATGNIGNYLPAGGIIIPVAPLPAGTYTATAALTGLPETGGADFDYLGGTGLITVRKRWSFTVTAESSDDSGAIRSSPPRATRRTVRIGTLRVSRGRLVIPVSLTGTSSVARASIRVTWTRVARCKRCRNPRPAIRTRRLARGRTTFRVLVPRGRWRAAVRVTRVRNPGGTLARLPTRMARVNRR